MISCAACSHPLDTIKTRMQLRSKTGLKRGPVDTAQRIVKNEGFAALYKGLSEVMVGIVPKMAVRFSSFEYYKVCCNSCCMQFATRMSCPPFCLTCTVQIHQQSGYATHARWSITEAE